MEEKVIVEAEAVEDEKKDGKVKSFFKRNARSFVEGVAGVGLLVLGLGVGYLFGSGNEEPELEDDGADYENENPEDPKE